MKKLEKKCVLVDYHSKDFASEVIACLKNDRVFALTGLPEELKNSMKDLFKSGDDLFDHMHEYTADEFPAIAELKNVRGLFRPEKIPFGCNNGARFFIAMNKDGSINNEKMPHYKDSPMMSRASVMFNRHTDIIIARIMEEIAKAHQLDAKELKESVIGDAIVGLTRYYPITQKRAAQLFTHNALAFTGNDGDEIEQFIQHRDISPITMLAYRGEPRGLLVKDEESKKLIPLSVDCGDEPYLIVLTGTTLKEMTNGNIRAAQHMVVTSPEDQHLEAKMDTDGWRFTLAKFTHLNRDQIEPLKTISGTPIQPPQPRKHQREYPIAKEKFYTDHFAKAGSLREKANVKEFPVKIAERYPSNVKCEDLYVAQLGEESIGAYKL